MRALGSVRSSLPRLRELVGMAAPGVVAPQHADPHPKGLQPGDQLFRNVAKPHLRGAGMQSHEELGQHVRCSAGWAWGPAA